MIVLHSFIGMHQLMISEPYISHDTGPDTHCHGFLSYSRRRPNARDDHKSTRSLAPVRSAAYPSPSHSQC
jgi:hypothetical protein